MKPQNIQGVPKIWMHGEKLNKTISVTGKNSARPVETESSNSYFISLLCPLLRMASSYSGMAFANSSWLHERLERRFASIIGNCFLIMGGWLD